LEVEVKLVDVNKFKELDELDEFLKRLLEVEEFNENNELEVEEFNENNEFDEFLKRILDVDDKFKDVDEFNKLDEFDVFLKRLLDVENKLFDVKLLISLKRIFEEFNVKLIKLLEVVDV
jgi:hypothetical protein